MKELPKVFKNNINKDIHNNREYYVSKNKEKEIINKENNINIYQKIKEIFSSYKYVYKADVVITTKDGDVKKTLIGMKDNNLITIDNELIDISIVKDIKFDE